MPGYSEITILWGYFMDMLSIQVWATILLDMIWIWIWIVIFVTENDGMTGTEI